MRNMVLSTWFLVLACIVCVPVAVAKSAPDKITISGADLAEPIVITDPKSLADWSPWAADFLAWGRLTIPEPATSGRRYEVLFYVEDRLKYVLQYDPNFAGERGYIYLPGPDEGGYKLNSGTIIQDGHDGYWHTASSAWDDQMRQVLRTHTLSASTPTLMPNAGMAMPSLWALVVFATGVLAAGVALSVPHHKRSGS